MGRPEHSGSYGRDPRSTSKNAAHANFGSQLLVREFAEHDAALPQEGPSTRPSELLRFGLDVSVLRAVLRTCSKAPYALAISNRSIPSSVSKAQKPSPGVLSTSGIRNYLGLARFGCIVIVLRLREMVSNQC